MGPKNDPFLGHFGGPFWDPFLGHLAKIPLWRPLNRQKGQNRGSQNGPQNGVKNGSFWGHFGPFWAYIPVFIGKIGVFGPIWPYIGPKWPKMAILGHFGTWKWLQFKGFGHIGQYGQNGPKWPFWPKMTHFEGSWANIGAQPIGIWEYRPKGGPRMTLWDPFWLGPGPKSQ